MENKKQSNAINAVEINDVETEFYLKPDPMGITADTAIAETMEASIEVMEAPEISVRVNELPALRGENSKVFRMSDGSEQAVFYAEPIHAFDKNTQRFELTDTVLKEKDSAFVGRQNRFEVEFSKDGSSNKLFHIMDGTHRVTVLGAKAGGQRQAPFADQGKMSDRVVYKQAEAGADLVYSLMGCGVKEDIIIKKKAEIYRYSFLLRTENVTSKFDEQEQRVAFLDQESGMEIFHIPAAFMSDADGNISANVSYEVTTLEENTLLLTVTADREWMNATERKFPVIIDPQIKVSGTNAMTTYSCADGKLIAATTHTVDTSENGNAGRMYISLTLPTLPRNPRIKKAELKFFQSSGSAQCGGCPKFGLYQVTENMTAGNDPPAICSDLIDYDTMKTGHCEDGEIISYSFDITKIVDAVNKGEITHANLAMKMLDEKSSCKDKIVLYGSSHGGSYAPQLVITYESSYGVNTSYRTHSHELGRFGQGSIDLACGNLMFESEDFAWAGNRMPVTLKHLYNSAIASYQYTANSGIKLNTANFASMKLGYGYKLNVMQSMTAVSFQHEGTAYTGYVYICENGEEAYFKQSNKTCKCKDNSQCYHLYEDVNNGEILYDPVKRILASGENLYSFDASGRLIKVTSGKNSMVITYASDRISSVTDGAGRVFSFAYNTNGFLTSITAPDGTNVIYTYSGNFLNTATYPNGKKVTIEYSSNRPSQVVLSENGANVYKVAYTYSGNRVASVTEYGVENGSFVIGASTAYSYSAAARRTVVTTTEQKDIGESVNNVIKTVYTFNDDGNIVSEYVYSQDTGNVGADGEESGIHPHSGDSGAGVASNINNLLVNHNFESLDSWDSLSCNCESFQISHYRNDSSAKFGSGTCWMRNYGQDCGINGIYQMTNVLTAGNYTFSVYAHIDRAFCNCVNPGVFIRVTDDSDNILVESERLVSYDTEYIRLIAPFVLDSSKRVKVQILINGNGSVEVDAAQLENNAFANNYNMLENGNFELKTDCWNKTAGVTYSIDTKFNMSKALCISGDLSTPQNASQKVRVKTNRSTRETFTLSGWAKGYGIVNRERSYAQTPQFRLRAVVKYYDTTYREYGMETYTADFSPCTEEWQFASVQFAKEKFRTIQDITVYCDYNYNCGNAYFDDIQLVRDNIEINLSASDFVIESTGENDEVEGAAIADTRPVFEEAKDDFGNVLTDTTFSDGEFGTIYRSFGFNTGHSQLAGDDTGNNLVRETDARGNETKYTVDGETSRNGEVADRLGNKTAYEYDASGRTAKVTSKKKDGTAIANVSYTYDSFDNMTGIVRGDGMKYVLKYNTFHNLESISVEGKSEKLIKYDYKNGNGRLKQITYANGDTMKATYNSIGQMIAEKWYDADNLLVAHYQYVYDGQGNIVRSLDILANTEYTYTYENGRIIRAAESVVTLLGETVTAKNLVNSILYTYDAEGRLTKKRIVPAGGGDQVIYYENQENENAVVKFMVDGKTVTSHSKTDSFGRKVFDELQIGNGFVSRQFHYHSGDVTEEHKAATKLKSSPTTQLVSQLVLSGGRMISYEYDAEERITKVTDSVDGITEYTYDALGQLLTETVNGVVKNTITYDNYGNIKSKNGVVYTYGNSAWKDLLTKVGNKTISYDQQGNPTNYLGHTLTWEKGRQLKSFDGNTYTYNANGIRTSKTVNGVKHSYILDGTKILRETWDGNFIIPLYDNEDSVCGIIYNGNPYYFRMNLQNDVIAIVNKDSDTIAQYSYDVWGVPSIVQDFSDCSIATINPFRYKGYYYDSELCIYYLQSRYYDPKICRFINSDDINNLEYLNSTIDLDLFTYTVNCPVFLTDECGEGWLKDKIKKAVNKVSRVATTVIGAVKKVVSTAKNSIKNVYMNVADFFKNTIWKKWLVGGFWNIFCKKWIWEKFCKEMVYNTFFKKWVWQTFCKKWTWATFCKKWVWQTFCKKWVWQTFCKKSVWETFCKKWVVTGWKWITDIDNLLFLLSGICTVVGGSVTIIGFFVSLPAWASVLASVSSIVGLVVFILQIIKMF